MDSNKCKTCDRVDVPLNPDKCKTDVPLSPELRRTIIKTSLMISDTLQVLLDEAYGVPEGLVVDQQEASASDVEALTRKRLWCQTCRVDDVPIDPKRKMCEACMIAEMEYVIREHNEQ